MAVLNNYSLLEHNTFGVDVRASRFMEYDSESELMTFLVHEGLQVPFLHIGRGSNLLFTKDYEGTVLHSCIRGVEILEEDDKRVRVRVGAGTLWDDFVACCVVRGWYGAENLSLIPGEVGASAVQNIGAYGVEVKVACGLFGVLVLERAAAVVDITVACLNLYLLSGALVVTGQAVNHIAISVSDIFILSEPLIVKAVGGFHGHVIERTTTEALNLTLGTVEGEIGVAVVA